MPKEHFTSRFSHLLDKMEFMDSDNYVMTCLVSHITDTFNPFPNKPWFLPVCKNKSFENTVGKGEIARNEQFLLFPQCFLPFWKNVFHFHQIQSCCLQTLSGWESLKFVVWESVKPLFQSRG